MESLTVAAVQFAAAPLAANTNLETAARLVQQAARQGARLIVLPELFNVGYTFDPRLATLGEPIDGPLARHVLLDRVGSERVAPDEQATDRLLAFLAAQLPPFAPDAVTVTADGVLVGFRYESAPDAVVTADTP